jgi:hypothetical protein
MHGKHVQIVQDQEVGCEGLFKSSGSNLPPNAPGDADDKQVKRLAPRFGNLFPHTQPPGGDRVGNRWHMVDPAATGEGGTPYLLCK